MGTAEPSTRELATTAVEDDEVVFRLGDPAHELEQVTLWVDLVRPAEWPDDLSIEPVDGGWGLRLGKPALVCSESVFSAGDTRAPDPGNPDGVDGAFGLHSWLSMP